MSIKRAITSFVAAGLLVTSQSALADPPGWAKKRHPDHGYRYDPGPQYDYARVVDVEPIIRQVHVSVPREQCWTETRYQQVEHRPQPHRGAAGSMILGGIIGAAVGNQFGGGDGRRAATVAGALIGSAIGHDVAERRNVRYAEPVYREERPYEVERCEVRYDREYEQRVEGYDVTYVYQGRRYTTRMPYDPGDRVRVRVDVSPEICNC